MANTDGTPTIETSSLARPAAESRPETVQDIVEGGERETVRKNAEMVLESNAEAGLRDLQRFDTLVSGEPTLQQDHENAISRIRTLQSGAMQEIEHALAVPDAPPLTPATSSALPEELARSAGEAPANTQDEEVPPPVPSKAERRLSKAESEPASIEVTDASLGDLQEIADAAFEAKDLDALTTASEITSELIDARIAERQKRIEQLDLDFKGQTNPAVDALLDRFEYENAHDRKTKELREKQLRALGFERDGKTEDAAAERELVAHAAESRADIGKLKQKSGSLWDKLKESIVPSKNRSIGSEVAPGLETGGGDRMGQATDAAINLPAKLLMRFFDFTTEGKTTILEDLNRWGRSLMTAGGEKKKKT